MDWKQCIIKKFVKDIAPDQNKFTSFKEIINSKISAAQSLDDKAYYAKVTLLYDALRSLLEIIALKKGYKIYNHECYTSFFKEKCNLAAEAEKFDNVRKIRNAINYYGKTFTLEEAQVILTQLDQLIKRFKKEV